MKLIGSLLIIVLILITLSGAVSEDVGKPVVPDEYSETERIYAALSISGGIATCSGRLVPSGTQTCNLVMKLFVKNGSTWSQVQSWSASATGGDSAGLVKTVTVGHGIYKVVCYGNVAGETSSVTSNVVSW